MPHIRLATVEALERFVEGGGKALGVLHLPERALGPDGLVDVSSRLRTAVAEVIEGDASAVLADAQAGGSLLADALREAIDRLIEPDLELDNDELFALHRVKDDRDVYFVVNPTFEAQTARMTIPSDAVPVLWDPTSGGELPVGPMSVEDGQASFELTLSPAGSTFVVTAVSVAPHVVGTNTGTPPASITISG